MKTQLVTFPKPITVDYSLSVTELVEMGSFDGGSSGFVHIARDDFWGDNRFEPEKDNGSEDLEVALLKIDKRMSNEEVLLLAKDVDRENPWRVGGVSALMTFSREFPEEQKKHAIVGLGSPTSFEYCHKYVPVLCTSIGHTSRYFTRLNQGCGWQAETCFLLIRNTK